MNSTSSPHPEAKNAAATRLGRLAGWSYDRRRFVLVGWLAALVIVSIIGGAVGSNFTDQFGGGHSESVQAQDFLKAHFPQQAGATADIVFHTTAPISDPASTAAIAAFVAEAKALPGIAEVTAPGPATPATRAQISSNGHTAYAPVVLTKSLSDFKKADVKRLVAAAEAANKPGFQVELGGQPIGLVEQPNMGSSEAIGLLAAIVILLVAFGSLIAMGLPIMTALFGLGIGIGILELGSHVLTVPTFGPEMAAMIALGVGIDYALFIVTRHRETLHRGASPRDAVITSLATAGRAVLFAGSTVVISLLGMLLLGLPFIYGLAMGCIAAVLLVMAAAVTLLPAMLGFSGQNIDKFGIQRFMHRGEVDKEHTFSYRWSRVVQHHPWIAGGAALVILLIMAIPLFSMQQSFTDAGNNQPELTTRKAYDLLAQGFGPGTNGPLVVAVDLGTAPGGQAALDKLHTALAETPGVAFAVPPRLNADGSAATLVVIPKTSPQAQATHDLVHHIRTDVVKPTLAGTGVTALVGGVTAASVDASTHLSSRLPWVIGGVVLLSFLLLMAVFRSVAVPVKAAVMNLLSIGAAYGVIVAVFQWGWLGGVIGIGKTGPIDPWVPLMLFTILFGLSMDYEVFLLSRVREEWLRTGNNATSVADGLAGTARVITAAAAIMVCVFGSFVLGDIRVLKLFGLGLAAAVFIDATLVRMVLVPATMELLGDTNWWFPRWLDRLVPELGVEVEFEDPEPERVPVSVG